MHYYFKADALALVGKYHDALFSYDRSLELMPDSSSSWYCKGLILQKLGRSDEADKCFKKAEQLDRSKI